MKLSIAIAALFAIPALAGLDYSGPQHKEFKETVYVEEEQDYHRKPYHHHHPHQPYHKHEHYEPGHYRPDHHRPEHHKDHHDHHPEPHKHKHTQYESDKYKKVKLTEKEVCQKLKSFAHRADKIYEKVEAIRCGKDYNHCWKSIKKEIYELEIDLDFFDIAIDEGGINKCWTARQESEIACCYKTYANAMIRLLKLVHQKSRHLEGEIDKYVVTVVNSIKAADYTFVYELVRRIQHDEYAREIMKKQGAVDGSTPGSIREAFALFVSTPYITGENFDKVGKPY